MKLNNQVALVTGASRGIGKAVAQTLAEAGALVIGTATSEKGAQAIAADLAAFKGQGMVLNVTDSDSIEALMSALKEGPGLPDILVNNAGRSEERRVGKECRL